MDLRRVRLLTLATAFAVAFLAFLPSLSAEFVDWDDTWILVRNEAYRGFGWEQLSWMATTTHKGPYQPLSWFSYAVDHAVWGMDPFGYHLTNNLLHALAALLLTGVALRLLPRLVPGLLQRPGVLHATALGAGLLWAAHPLRAESVAWATERRDVLSGALLLASLWAWLVHLAHSRHGHATGRPRAYWGSVALYTLSLLAKATAMGWWVVLFLLDLLIPRDVPLRRRVLEKLPFVLVSLPIAAMALWGQSDTGASWSLAEYGVLDRVLLAGYSAAFYVVRTVLPLGLRAHYERDFPLTWDLPLVAGTLATAAVSLVALRSIRCRSNLHESPTGGDTEPAYHAAEIHANCSGTVWAVAWWAYLVLLAPVSGLVVVGTHLVAERYSYQSTFPLALAAAGGAAWLVLRVPRPQQRLAGGACALVLVALSALAWRTAATWRTTESLFANVLASEPDNWLAHMKVGFAKADRGVLDEARDHLYRSIDLYGVKRSKSCARLAHIEFGRGDFAAAGRLADRALRDDPENGTAWSVRARLLDRDGRLDEAETALDRALALSDRDPATLAHLAWIKIQKREPEAASALLDEALTADPRHAGAWRLRGVLRERTGDLPGAEAALRTSIERMPDDPAAVANLGVVLQKQNRSDEAEAAFRRALDLDPALLDPRFRLSFLLEQRGRTDEARALYLEAVERAPDSGEAHYRLAQFLQRSDDLPAAETHYRRSLELNPDVAPALGSLARVLAAQGKDREAVQFCAKACSLMQDQPGPHVELGALLERIERFHDAERAYRHSLKLAPDTPAALLRLARLLVRDPRAHDEAAKLFERFLDRNDDPGTRLSLAELYRHDNRPEPARSHAERALDDARKRGDSRLIERAEALLAKL